MAIHLVDHRKVLLPVRIRGKLRELGEEFLLREEAVMDVVEPDVEIERTVFVPPDEVDRSIHVDLGHLVLGHIADRALTKLLALLRQTTWRQNAIPESLERYERLVKAVGLRQRCIIDVASPAHVPLSEVRRCISGISKRPRDSRSCRIQEIAHAAFPVALARVQVRMNHVPSRVLARGDSNS